MRVVPISCLRPAPEHAGRFAAPPYDVFDNEQARAYVQAHPKSFLDVDRPETAFAPDYDMYAPEVYAHAADVGFGRARLFTFWFWFRGMAFICIVTAGTI